MTCQDENKMNNFIMNINNKLKYYFYKPYS